MGLMSYLQARPSSGVDGSRRARRRKGSASMEAVLTAAVTLPLVALLCFGGIHACLRIYQVVVALVAMPLP